MATIPSGCQNLKQKPDIGDYCCLDAGQPKCPQNSVCNPTSSKCEKGQSYCTPATESQDCQGGGKFLGVTCVNNQCTCTKIGSLCTDTTVCVPGSAPSPDPGPDWPASFQPPPGKDIPDGLYTGLCSNSVSKAWFNDHPCPVDQENLGTLLANAPAGSTPQCVPPGNWTGDEPWKKYSKICYIPKKS